MGGFQVQRRSRDVGVLLLIWCGLIVPTFSVALFVWVVYDMTASKLFSVYFLPQYLAFAIILIIAVILLILFKSGLLITTFGSKSKIDFLTRKIDSLKYVANKQHKAVSSMKKEGSLLQNDMLSMQDTMTSHKEHLASIQTQKKKIEKELHVLTKEHSKMQKAVAVGQEENERQHKRKTHLQTEIKTVLEAHKTKEKAIQRKTKELVSLEKKASQLDDKIATKIASLKTLQTAVTTVPTPTTVLTNGAQSMQDVIAQVRGKYTQFPVKNKQQRVELERFVARLVQEQHSTFTTSQVLTVMVNAYVDADSKRDTLRKEITKWVENDSFVKKVANKGVATEYKLL
ncbi:hypothetical protein CL620_03220 [archaeon]|nr:hypothetical protein [archaeon]